MRANRGIWASSGVLVGLAGVAVAHALAAAAAVRQGPIVAVTEWFIDAAPGSLIEGGISLLGRWDKPVLVGVVSAALLVAFLVAGLLARRSANWPIVIYLALAGIGALAVLTSRQGSSLSTMLPVLAGLVTWLLTSHLLFEALRRPAAASRVSPSASPGGDPSADPATAKDAIVSAPVLPGSARRAFLLRAGAVGAVAVASGVLGEWLDRGRRRADQARRLLKLPITDPGTPAKARVGVRGIAPWQTPAEDFYVIHTAIAPPTVSPDDYRLRIHGLVDTELTFTYAELATRSLEEGWITLNCVSNEIGGDLIGNAWWSGVRLADLLAEAGVQPGADAVLQTSHDGWTCGTPLAALTDPDRLAMLALGMNGEPLPVLHGFPVRTIVPGLYGYVSATKWVVDLEVTRFEDFTAYWTDKGWAEQAPVKMSSRIDVPRGGAEVGVGTLDVGGSAWVQHTGVAAVEYALDGGAWQPAELGAVPSIDSWVQWRATVSVDEGDHILRVRATDRNGVVQTDVVTGVLPDGATGLHEVRFTAG